MQTNYYYLRQLSAMLAENLTDLVLAECFSQEKDELVLGFCTDGKQWKKKRQFYIKAIIRPDFVCFNFPDDFRRAGKNSVNLFTPLIDQHVTQVRQFLNERAFAIIFENGHHLVFKLFGNRSNIILVENDAVTDLFHNKLIGDNNLIMSGLDRKIDQSFEAFNEVQGNWQKLFPTFGKEVSGYLTEALANLSMPQKWEVLQTLRKSLENPQYFLKNLDHELVFSLLNQEPIYRKLPPNIIEATNEFYYHFTRQNAIEKEKGQTIRALKKQIDKAEAYLDHQYRKMSSIDEGVSHEQIGHILMANLHEIPERAEEANLWDFYRNKYLKIKLKPDFSPQRNAEIYYRKAKNEKIETEKIQENIEGKEAELARLKGHLSTVESAENLKNLRKYLKEQGLDHPQTQESGAGESPFKQVDYQGFQIFIGRNAKNNDLLTQRHARKEDLWLHARDVSGSHVVIRHQAGKKFPTAVIEKAAQLAAFYSKRKNDSLCPVIVTPRKFVRKTKDLADGQVIIEKEEVILVVPEA